MAILNLTQHQATPEQVAQGVVDLQGDDLVALRDLLTFDGLPTVEEIASRAHDIALLAALSAAAEDRGDDRGFADRAMIGGAPYLMSALEGALMDQGIEPVYSFSRRESVEETQEDGSVRKINVFRHVGFVEARK